MQSDIDSTADIVLLDNDAIRKTLSSQPTLVILYPDIESILAADFMTITQPRGQVNFTNPLDKEDSRALKNRIRTSRNLEAIKPRISIPIFLSTVIPCS